MFEMMELLVAAFLLPRLLIAAFYVEPDEPHIPTALEDWDADFTRATGQPPRL